MVLFFIYNKLNIACFVIFKLPLEKAYREVKTDFLYHSYFLSVIVFSIDF